MTTIRIPTPLRTYVAGQTNVTAEGETVQAVLDALTTQYPDLRNHLFEGETLRSFVNVYLNKEDIRHLEGGNTAVSATDTLMIVPSIAGGAGETEAIFSQVDQSALKVNQAFIMLLLAAAFVLNSWGLVAFVAVVMLLGTAVPDLALFQQIYRRLLRPAGLVKPDVIADSPAPHRFAQGFGGVVVLSAAVALVAGATTLGWLLAGLVIFLAGLNFLLGFCAGCFVYYQLTKLSRS